MGEVQVCGYLLELAVALVYVSCDMRIFQGFFWSKLLRQMYNFKPELESIR